MHVTVSVLVKCSSFFEHCVKLVQVSRTLKLKGTFSLQLKCNAVHDEKILLEGCEHLWSSMTK